MASGLVRSVLSNILTGSTFNGASERSKTSCKQIIALLDKVRYRFNATSRLQLMHTHVQGGALACARGSPYVCEGKHLRVRGESHDCVSRNTRVLRAFRVMMIRE